MERTIPQVGDLFRVDKDVVVLVTHGKEFIDERYTKNYLAMGVVMIAPANSMLYQAAEPFLFHDSLSHKWEKIG